MKASEAFGNIRLNGVECVDNGDETVTVKIYKHGWKRQYSFVARRKMEDGSIDTSSIIEDEEITEEV